MKSFEGFDDGRLDDELLGFLTKGHFLFKVAFKVEVAELFVDFYLIEELFDEEVVVLPKVVDVFARDVADRFPVVLNGIELVVGGLEGFVFVVNELPQLVKDMLFFFEVFLFLEIEGFLEFLPFVAEGVVGFAEGVGYGVVGVLIVFFCAAVV